MGKALKLKNKTAVVTGAGKGIGRAIAELFVAEGARVIAADVLEIPYACPEVTGYKLDITDSAACRRFCDTVIEKYGAIDILVNNAGITRDALTRKMSDEMWDLVLAVNLKGVFNLTRYLGPHMQEKKSGAIINISSRAGVAGNVGQANYAASKAGIIGLTKTWAKEFARKGGNVRVNAIAPGFIMTDIVKTVPQSVLDAAAKEAFLGRLGQPDEIASVALFLAGDDSSYITGEVINVTGGM